MLCHPVVLAVARSLSASAKFMRWMGHAHPVVMPLEPIAMIALATLIRIHVRYGKWDASPVKINVRAERFDEEIGVPGILDAMWAADLIGSMTKDSIIIRAKPGAFPKNYEASFEARDRAKAAAALSAVRESVLCGMASPRPGPTPEA